MFWRKKDDDEGMKLPDDSKLPEGFELPEGVDPDSIANIFAIDGPGDLEKLPVEALRGLTACIMAEHGKLLFTSRELCMELSLMLIQLYGTALETGADEAAKFLKRGLDMIGSYLVVNQILSERVWNASVQIGLDMVAGKVADKDEAMERLREALGADAESIVKTNVAPMKREPVKNTAPAEEIERIRKMNDAFGAALNPNSNRAKRADDAF